MLFIPVAIAFIPEICLVPFPSSVYLFPGILPSPVSLGNCCFVDFFMLYLASVTPPPIASTC